MQLSKEMFQQIKENLKPKTKTRVLSHSMEPYLSANETIEVSPYAFDKLRIGDVIVFWRDQTLICHLVMKINHSEKNSVITKGLSADEFDLPVYESDYLGLVTSPQLSWWRRLLFKCFLKFSPTSP